MQLYLALPPDRVKDGLSMTSRLAHAAFCVSADGALLSQPLPPALRGGWMLLSCRVHLPPQAAAALSREIMDVCISRHFAGIVLDAEGHCCAACRPLLPHLLPLCAQQHRQLYVPEALAHDAPQARVLVCTALSGGTLRYRLEEAVCRYGAQRIALDLQRLMMDFPLPCPGGEGTPLTPERLQQLQKQRRVYYCGDLCAHYFTYACGNQPHFVLFDNAESMLRKMELAERLGIREGFVVWQEVQDLLQQLFAKKKEGEP